jgi:hypothetical protein
VKIHISIICIFLTALIGVGAWAGTNIVDLKADVAAIKAALQINIAHK